MRLSDLKPQQVFLYTILVFGFFSSLLMPILVAPDENQHFQVAYSIFSANKKPGTDLVYSEGMMVERALNDSNYLKLFTEKTSAMNDGLGINTGSIVFDGKTRASVFDILHLPQAIGVAIGKSIYPSLGVMVVAGRLANLLVYALSLYFIIRFAPFAKWSLVFIATIPMMLQQASTLSYDAVNLIAIFLWFAVIAKAATQKGPLVRKELILIGISLLMLLICKSNNILLGLMLFAIPFDRIRLTTQYGQLKALRFSKLIMASLALIGVIACTLLVLYMWPKILAGEAFEPYRLFMVLMRTFLLEPTLIDVATIGIFGQFASFNYHLPVWVSMTVLISLLYIVITDKTRCKISKQFAVLGMFVFISSVLLITIALYYAWAMKPYRLGEAARVADGIQGRYFLPLLVLLLPWLQRYTKIFSVKAEVTRRLPVVVLCSVSVFSSIYLLQTYYFFWR